MPFVSYAQNCEDAVLWRVLADYSPGFYIDVGAGDPVAESVTKAFSMAGWRGINIEPMPAPMELLRKDRPRDINLQIALEAEPNTRRYFSVQGGNGLSTGVEDHAARYRGLGWPVDEIEVEVDTLANVCARFVNDEIHFLKIDAEGSEAAILSGADFGRFRPWILVVEAVAPCVLTTPDAIELQRTEQPTVTHELWEPILTAAGYQFVLFDGLNRFYVATEKADLFSERLSAPCNVLDGVISASDLAERDEERRTTLRVADDDVQRALAEANELRAQILEISEAFNAERSSLQLEYSELSEAFSAEASSLQTQNHAVTDSLKATGEVLLLVEEELDRAYQQLYELSRHISSLAAQLHRRNGDVAEAQREIAEAQHQASLWKQKSEAWEHQGAALTRELNAVVSSKAWRVMKPLRSVRRIFRHKPDVG